MYSWLCKVDYVSPWSNLMPVFVTRGFVWLTTLVRGVDWCRCVLLVAL